MLILGLCSNFVSLDAMGLDWVYWVNPIGWVFHGYTQAHAHGHTHAFIRYVLIRTENLVEVSIHIAYA